MAETTYTKKIDGRVYERTAHTPADHVELEFTGWVKKKPESKSSSAGAGDSKPAK